MRIGERKIGMALGTPRTGRADGMDPMGNRGPLAFELQPFLRRRPVQMQRKRIKCSLQFAVCSLPFASDVRGKGGAGNFLVECREGRRGKSGRRGRGEGKTCSSITYSRRYRDRFYTMPDRYLRGGGVRNTNKHQTVSKTTRHCTIHR